MTKSTKAKVGIPALCAKGPVAEEKQLEPLTAKERKKFSQGMPLDPATKNAVCWQFVSHGRCPFTEAYRYAHTVPASRSPTEVELGLMDFGGSH